MYKPTAIVHCLLSIIKEKVSTLKDLTFDDYEHTSVEIKVVKVHKSRILASVTKTCSKRDKAHPDYTPSIFSLVNPQELIRRKHTLEQHDRSMK